MTIPKMRLTLSLALAAAFSGGYFLHDRVGPSAALAATPPSVVAAPAADAVRTAGLPDFSAIASALGSAVVNISVSGTMKATATEVPGIDPDSPFYDFFRHFGVPGTPGGGGRMPTQGLGSGFIVDPDGVILTNAHVVSGADTVTVKLTDRREFKAKVVGLDKQTDVAVLRIDAKNLPTVKIGNADTAKVGEWVVAIGAPFGFENSVTAGIISAKSRALPDEGYVPFMQTDVAVNPGNSGGPLINTRGEVIGINSQIYSRSGGYEGLSFAIPINVAMDVGHQLLTKGKVTRGRLGVAIQEVNQGLADSFGLDKPRGALVGTVEPGSAAAKAGIRAGDIIIRFNDKDVARSSELPALVAATPPGSQVMVRVWRNRAETGLTLTVGELKNLAEQEGGSGPDQSAGKLGLALRALTREERNQTGVGQGILVEDVNDGPAARAGIRAGDVILAVNGEQVGSVGQLRARIEHVGKRIALLVQRGENKLFVPVNLG